MGTIGRKNIQYIFTSRTSLMSVVDTIHFLYRVSFNVGRIFGTFFESSIWFRIYMERLRGSPRVYEFPWNRKPRTRGHSCGQHEHLCLCGGFLYGGTDRTEQEVSGQLVSLCPNGSCDVIVFLEDAAAALRCITSRSLSLLSD